jgi:lipoprotein-releasing system permease protein
VPIRVVLFVALRQLWDRKLLNSIAVLGVMLGILTLIAIRGMMNGMQGKFLLSILRISPHVSLYDKELRPAPPILSRHLGTHELVARLSHQTPSDRQLRVKRPDDVVRSLERMDGVIAAAPLVSGSAIVAYGGKELPVQLRGIDPARQDRVTPISQFVKQGSYRTFVGSTDGVLLGVGVAERIGARAGDLVTLAGPRGQRLTVKVAGIFEAEVPPVDNVRIYAPIRLAQTLLDRPDVVGQIDLRLSDPDRAPELAERIETVFGYDAESWQETNANFLGIFAMQNSVTNFVVLAILLVGGFGILAIQVMIVLQKTRDIAILRSVGFHRRDILVIFLLQGMLVALVGALVGDLVGHYLLVALGNLKVKMEGFIKSDTFLVEDDPKMYLWGALFALVVGTLASLLPAIRASKVEPVDVLRGQIG